MALPPWTELAAILVAAAFLPTLVLLAVVRGDERRRREPWRFLVVAYLYGAVGSAILAILLDPLAAGVAHTLWPGLDAGLAATVVAAPLVEEAVKGYGVAVTGRITRTVDGIVYGFAVGLGFAATENLLYTGTAYLQQGLAAWATLLVVRSFSSALLHPAATAFTGLGIAWTRRRGLPSILVLPFYGAAVLLHGAYNYAASALPPLDVGPLVVPVRLLAAVLLASTAFGFQRWLVARLSA